MTTVALREVDALIDQINSMMAKAGPSTTFVGTVRIEDLGIDLGFNNRDCNGRCNTSCSGCTACSGCSGCQNTSSSTQFNPAGSVSNPNPLDQFVASLRDPAVLKALSDAAKIAG